MIVIISVHSLLPVLPHHCKTLQNEVSAVLPVLMRTEYDSESASGIPSLRKLGSEVAYWDSTLTDAHTDSAACPAKMPDHSSRSCTPHFLTSQSPALPDLYS